MRPKWAIANPLTGAEPTVGNGHLTLPVIPRHLLGGHGSPQMLLEQARRVGANPAILLDVLFLGRRADIERVADRVRAESHGIVYAGVDR